MNFRLLIIILIITTLIILYNFYAGYLQLRIYLKQTTFLGYIFAAVLYIPFFYVFCHFPYKRPCTYYYYYYYYYYIDIYAVETPWDNVHV